MQLKQLNTILEENLLLKIWMCLKKVFYVLEKHILNSNNFVENKIPISDDMEEKSNTQDNTTTKSFNSNKHSKRNTNYSKIKNSYNKNSKEASPKDKIKTLVIF